MKLIQLEGEPKQYKFEELDKLDVRTLKSAINEAVVGFTKGNLQEPPDIEDFKKPVMRLETPKEDTVSFTVEASALKSLSKVLDGFRERTPGRTDYISKNTNVHDHLNGTWFDREEMGERAVLIGQMVNAVLPEVNEMERQFADSPSLPSTDLVLYASPQTREILQANPAAPQNDQPTQ